jgi:excisionase family DNA binding protein
MVVKHKILSTEVYTPLEVQEILKISKSTFLRLIKDGKLKARKVGGQYRILGSELLRVLQPIGKK